MSTANTSGAAVERSVNRTTSLVFGAIYTLVGIAGFFVTDGGFLDRNTEDELILFEVNHLHNVVHLLIGLALLAASRRTDLARTANLAIGVTYLALGVLGPFIDDGDANILSLNGADHGLHLATGAVLTLIALTQDKRDDRDRGTART